MNFIAAGFMVLWLYPPSLILPPAGDKGAYGQLNKVEMQIHFETMWKIE